MTNENILERLERVEASLAIQQLPARYAMAVDTRDLDALAALYVDDVDFGERGRGHAVLKAYFTVATRQFYRSVHQILGHTFEFIDNDHATGRVYCRAEHERGKTWIVAVMGYFDHYVKQDGRWLFAKPRDWDFFYCADMLEHPQDVDFQRLVIPGMRLDLPMMLPRFPSWKSFWEQQGSELVSQLTSRP